MQPLPSLADIAAERARRRSSAQDLDDARKLAIADEDARRHLVNFVERTVPGYVTGWVHRELCREMEAFYADVARGKAPRLIVCMPPQTGKSQIIAGRAPVWAMGRYPGLRIALATYGQSLANQHSRDARECARSETTARIFPDIRPKRRTRSWYADYRRNDLDQVVAWQVGGPVDATGHERRGSYKAVGVGGPLTGFPANALILDDPFKDASEADSADRREKVHKWFRTAARTRMAPGGGGICVTMTRWHDDDTVGRLIAAMEAGGEKWRVVIFPAIAEADEYSMLDGRLLRRMGEPLHPERRALAEYEALKGHGDVPGTIDEYEWASLYQQRPIPLSGGIVRPEDLSHRYLVLPAEISRKILSLDTATSEDPKADYSVILSGAEKDARKHIENVIRKRVDFPELISLTFSEALRVDPNVVLIEDHSSGRQLGQMLRDPNWCPGWRWPIEMIKPEQIGNKKRRLSLETPALRAGLVWIPEWAAWVPDFKAEVLGAPRYKTWDQADALSQWLRYIRENPWEQTFAEMMARW